MESHHTNVDGIRMRWMQEGEGLPIVLLHGIPTSPLLWRHVVPQIEGKAEGARSLAWEMVGYGASIGEGRGRDLSVGRQADYLIAWMETLGLERAVLVGHDLGGGVAQIAAVRHPEHVRGLVLVNSISYDSWPIPSIRIMQALAPLVERLPDRAFRLAFSLLVHRGHDDALAARRALRTHWRHYAKGGGARAFVRQIKALDNRDTMAVAGELPRLEIPARLVWGAAAPFQKIHYGERLARDLKAPLDRIEGGRHFIPEDHPDRVATAVNKLLAELAPEEVR